MPDVRREAARLAFALIRFAGAIAYPMPGSRPSGAPEIGREAWIFAPSWKPVPRDEVEAFLAGLSSPALISPTLARGSVVLLLVDELQGERRKWADKTRNNFVGCLDETVSRLGLTPASRVLVEFDDESLVFSLAAVRAWALTLAVEVGWNLARLDGEPRAEAVMKLLRHDGKTFPGRSSMIPGHWA